MPDTPTSAEPSPEWLKLMAGLIRSGSFIAREEREKIAAALSRLAQVERERDASDAVVAAFVNAKLSGVLSFLREYPMNRQDQNAAIERHKRSLQQRGTT